MLRKSIWLGVILVIFNLGILNTKAEEISTVPIPTIPLSKDNSGTISFQVDDLSIYSQTKLVYLKNLTASEVEPFIRTRLSKFGAVQINDQENLLIVTDREPKLSDIVKLIRELDSIGKKDFLRLETEMIPVQFIKASKVKDIAIQRLSSDGTVQADDDINILIVTDVRSKIKQFKQIVRSLDIPLKQVVIEARIIETGKSTETRVGIDWVQLLSQSLLSGVSYDVSKTKQSSTTSGAPTQQDSTRKTFSLGVRLSENLDSILNILNEKGNIKIVATPNIIGVNNKTSEIFVGTSYYYDKAGVGLKITPTIGNSELITLNIEAYIGELVSTEYSYSTVVSQEMIKSTVVVKNNESFIIGGLVKKSKENTIRRFPVLGYILPFIFSKHIDRDVYSEVAFVITPHIVEAPITSSEELEKLEEKVK